MDRARTIPIAPDSAIGALRTLNSGERLLGLYDYGLDGCTRQNREQVTAVLEELIGLLDFGYGEVAEGFYRLYVFCLRQAREGKFDQPAWILRDLRDTWAQALSDAAASAAPPLSDRATQVG